MNNFFSHLTPLQWFNLLVPFLVLFIVLFRWVSQRGKPAPVRTYRQGCVTGVLIGMMIGIWIGIGIALYVQITRFN